MNELITKDEVLYLHQLGIEAFGGSLGLRDEPMLESALAQPNATFGGHDLHPNLLAKVGALGFSIVANHAFVDGNKRVGFSAMAAVLTRNGFRINCSPEEGERITLAVAAGACDREGLIEWLHDHTQKIAD